MSKLYIISSVAGGGKSTLIRMFLDKYPEFAFSVSCTTRSPREEDIPGKTYHFLTRQEFQKIISSDGFLEWEEVHGNYYGTPKGFIEECLHSNKKVILDIDVKGAMTVKKILPEAITIFIKPPSREVWIQRLTNRGSESRESLERRIVNGEIELTRAEEFDHRVVNDSLQDAFLELENILLR